MTRQSALPWLVPALHAARLLAFILAAALLLAAVLLSVLAPVLGAPEIAPTRWDSAPYQG